MTNPKEELKELMNDWKNYKESSDDYPELGAGHRTNELFQMIQKIVEILEKK